MSEYCYLELRFPRNDLNKITEVLNKLWNKEEQGAEPYDGDIEYKKWWDALDRIGNCNIAVIYEAYNYWHEEIRALKLAKLDLIVLYGAPVFNFDVIRRGVSNEGPLTGTMDVCIYPRNIKDIKNLSYDDITNLDLNDVKSREILNKLIDNNLFSINYLKSALLYHKTLDEFVTS